MKKYKIQQTLITLVVFMILIAPIFVSGSEHPPTPITNPLEAKTLSEFIEAGLKIVSYIAFLVAVFFIVYAGFLFVTARGDPTKLTKARSAFLWAVVGTAVVLGARLFADAIQGTVKSIGG